MNEPCVQPKVKLSNSKAVGELKMVWFMKAFCISLNS